MSSHFARLKEDLDAKQLDLQEEQAAVESIEKLRKELEAQEKALVAKSTELYNRQREVTSMQQRLDTLTAVEPGITAAMHTKSSTQDVVRHVIENAIRGDHMTGSEIVQMTLDTAMHVNGRSRDANLDDFLIDLIVDEKSVGAAVDAAAENLNIYHVLQRTVATAMRNGERSANLEDCFKMTMDLFVGKNGTAAESSKPQGWYHRHSCETLRVL